MSTLLTLLALVPFYLCGAFPTGHLIARRRGINLSQTGSGNVGATNVARAAGRQAGLLTLLGDALKGWLAVWLAHMLSADPRFAACAGLAAVAGHCFSIPGRLRGGKGVATALGVFLQLSPVSAMVGAGVFALVFAVFRYVSLASVAAALAVPVTALFSGATESTSLAAAAISLLVVARHKDNLLRLSAGKEPRFQRQDAAGP